MLRTRNVFPSYPNLKVLAEIAKVLVRDVRRTLKWSVRIGMSIKFDRLLPERIQLRAILPVTQELRFAAVECEPIVFIRRDQVSRSDSKECRAAEAKLFRGELFSQSMNS